MDATHNPSSYKAHIDGLRAVAVLVVIFFHLGLGGFSGGFVGVDVFFVISGYLITSHLLTELRTTGDIVIRDFYLRRVRRLLPAYLVMLFAVTAVAVLLFTPAKLERFGSALNFAVVGLSNFVFWSEADYFDVSAFVKPLLHTWSLSVEEQFYAVWPLFLLIVYRWAPRLLFWVVALVGSLSLAGNIVLPFLDQSNISSAAQQQDPNELKATLFYLTPFRVFELAIGALLAWRKKAAVSNTSQSLQAWVGMVMIAVAVWAFDEQLLFPSVYALLPCVGAALIIASGGAGIVGWLLSHPSATGIGRLSYSLYLYHWPVIVFWSYLKVTPLDTLDRCLILALSVLLAFVSYRFIEQPFRVGNPLGLNGKRLAAAGSVCVLAFLGNVLHQSGGMPWRTPATSDPLVIYGGEGYPREGLMGEDNEPIDVMLVGDSHARQYAYGLDRYLVDRLGLNVYVHAGLSCLHLPGITRDGHEADWLKLCPRAVDRVARMVNGQATPPLVILSHAWLSQMHKSSLIKSGNKPLGEQDVIRSIHEFKAMIGDAPLLVIGQVPTANGIDVADVVVRPMHLTLGLTARFARLPLLNTHSEFNQALAEYAANSEGIEFFDPTDTFCQKGQCATMDRDRRAYYSDSNHLNRRGADLVVAGLLKTNGGLIPERSGYEVFAYQR